MKLTWMVCIVLLLAAPGAFAQVSAPSEPNQPQAAAPLPPPPPPGGGKWWKHSATAGALGLTDAQAAQLEAVFLQHQAHLSELRGALMSEERELSTLLRAERLDEQAIAMQIQKVSGARLALINENEEMTLEMRRVMTAEQWRKLEKIRQERAIPPAPPSPPAPPPPPPPPPGLKKPVVIAQPLAPYTEDARRARIEGIVLLEADINKDGSVGLCRVLRGLGYGLDESAVRTVTNTWRFRPGTLNGAPVNFRVRLEISFRLYNH